MKQGTGGLEARTGKFTDSIVETSSLDYLSIVFIHCDYGLALYNTPTLAKHVCTVYIAQLGASASTSAYDNA